MTTQQFIYQLVKEAEERYKAGKPLPVGWPTMSEQKAYWDAKEQENGENDWLEEEAQYSNYPNREL